MSREMGGEHSESSLVGTEKPASNSLSENASKSDDFYIGIPLEFHFNDVWYVSTMGFMYEREPLKSKITTASQMIIYSCIHGTNFLAKRWATLSYATLGKWAKVSKKQCTEIVKELENLGLITVRRQKQRPNSYHVNFALKTVSLCDGTEIQGLQNDISKGEETSTCHKQYYTVDSEENTPNYSLSCIPSNEDVRESKNSRNIANTCSLNSSEEWQKNFKKPTIKEVEDYVNEIGLDVDPEYFWDYNASIGWQMKYMPIKDWRYYAHLMHEHSDEYDL